MIQSFPRLLLSAALLGSGASTALAQSFVAGDLWARGVAGLQGVVARIDGSGNWLPLLTGPLSSNTDDFRFDPYRARIVMAWQATPTSPRGLHSFDTTGNVTLIAGIGVMPSCISPAGDGRVYMLTEGLAGGRFRCADAAGTVHVLTDAATGQPWVPGFAFGGNTAGMIYDAGTNALICAQRGNVNAGCSGNPSALILHKVPLSADGLRVVGPAPCLEPFTTYWGAVPDPCGFSRLPNGNLLLATNVITGSPVNPALLEIDPIAFTASPWASPDFGGANAIGAGTWSNSAGGARVLDLANDVLRTYTQGSGGAGSGQALAVDLSGGQLAEIPPHAPACDGTFTRYGTGLAGTGGNVPQLGARGCPDLGQTFELLLSKGLGGGLAIFAFGAAPASFPLFGGTVLLGQVDLLVPVLLTGPPTVGGAGIATLPLSFNVPSAVGASLFVQGAVFDGGAVQGLALSAGLQVTVGP